MTDTILARNIVALRKHLKLNQVDFAERLDTQQANVSKWESGKTAPEGVNLSSLAELAGVSGREFRDLSWSPPGKPKSLDIARAPEQMPTRGAYDDMGSVKLRQLDLSLAMGDGTDIEEWIDETTVEFDANWLHTVTAAPSDRLIMGRGVGDSMAPTIGDHDQVLIDLNQNQLEKGDRIYALTINGSGAVKRLFPASRGQVEVLSDNPGHPNRVRVYDSDEIRIIGRVVWSGRRH